MRGSRRSHSPAIQRQASQNSAKRRCSTVSIKPVRGCYSFDLPASIAAVESCPNPRLGWLMTMPPWSSDGERVRLETDILGQPRISIERRIGRSHADSDRLFDWVLSVVSDARPAVRHLHRRSERARREDAFRPRGARARRQDHARRSRSPNFCGREERARYTYPQVRVIPPGGPYFKMPWEKISQGLHRHQHGEHGARSRETRGQRGRHPARSGDQGSAQHRPDRADPLPREREQSLRVPVRHQAADRARDGLLRLGAAPAHRQFRSEDRTGAGSTSRRAGAAGRRRDDRHFDQRPAQESARPQRVHGPANAAPRRRATAWCSMPR